VALRRQVAGTTLPRAVDWACGAAIAWWLWVAGQFVDRCWLDRNWSGVWEQAGYLAAVLSLCPPMAVLGARRPTNRAWTGFVLAPLVIVLMWPVVTQILHGGWNRPPALETPHIVGFLLVLVMGYGNYLGGPLTFPALLSGGGLLLFVLHHAQLPRDGSDRVAELLALLVAGCGALAGARRLLRATPAPDRFDRVWQEFSLLFGLVWSRRVLDRVNALAEKQQWPGRLFADGFHWNRPPDRAVEAQVEHALRWLLRRFVDPGWLDARLGSADKSDSSPLPIDT
jgi:hypothetical protein